MSGEGFDPFGTDYHQRLDRCLRSLGGKDGRYYNRLKADWLVRLAEKHLGRLTDKIFLDLGCGTGLTVDTIASRFAFGVGLDRSRGMIQAAQPGGNRAFVLGDAGALPFPNRSFDLIFSLTMLHHLRDPELREMFRESRRVLRPGGLAVHFDHNPYNFLARKVVELCEFDDEKTAMRSLRAVAAQARNQGFRVVETGYIAFIPRIVGFLDPIEPLLKHLPLGGQYFLAAVPD
jgi:SAM-dependent methyltransferase